MKKYIVETYYTCTFKTLHTLDNLNENELSKIDERKDGDVEVIDVKLNNRKTKKIGEQKQKEIKDIKADKTISNEVKDHKSVLKKIDEFNNTNVKIKNKARFKMPDRRKGYIQKAQIGDHKFTFFICINKNFSNFSIIIFPSVKINFVISYLSFLNISFSSIWHFESCFIFNFDIWRI